MNQVTKEKDNTINKKLDYIGLDLQNVPEFLKEFKPLEFRPLKLYTEENQKTYRYLDVKDIQIMITTSNKSEDLKTRYKNADPIYFYMVPEGEEDIIKCSMFLKKLKEMNLEKLKEISKEQEKFSDHIPFEVKYLKNYLWQIYYAEETNQYFMLASIEEQDMSCLFYLLKQQIEARENKERKKIYVPINNVEYSRNYLKKSELQDVEKYLWLFTKDWPISYNVWDKDENESIQIVGNTTVYEKIKSNYKIELNNKEDAVKFYKLLKALFILQTELSQEYHFEVMISEKGDLDFLYDNKVINYEGLSKFIKKEYEFRKENIVEIQKELDNVNKKLIELTEIEKEKEEEYKRKEKQIATFLEYRKTFLGRIKYFFKKGKMKKEQVVDQNKQEEKKQEERKEISIEEKDYYTIEDLLQLCKIFESLNIELKNKMLDKKALEYKVENISIKLQNAIQYIEEINEHKKSLLEFWKFANKDSVLGLVSGTSDKSEVKQKTMNKIFDYEEDFEDLGNQIDKYQRKELSKEECDSIYLTTTEVLKDINKLRENKESNLKEGLDNLIEKAGQKLFSEEEFDIFGSVSEDHTKIKTLGNKKHREIRKDEIQILDIRKNTTYSEYKEELEKHLEKIGEVTTRIKSVADISIYMAQDKVLNTEELRLFHINPKSALEEVKSLDKVNLYRINLKQGMPAVGCSNIIFYDNKNKTLPEGMEVADEILLDMSKYKFELKRQKLFRLNQSVNQIEAKNKIICVYEYDVTI